MARVGCAFLEGTDGTSADVLARTQEIQREILAAEAKSAASNGADVDRIAADMKTIAALAEALRASSLAIVQAAGNGPAKLPPCPTASATTSTTAAPSQP